ncbi:MAG: hypothetical protein LBI18_11560 [Planctomycetaceae bacterium]|jgi:hypothetical protein|nr:hypothetical protein [Planctomycetaceae bacterium]
MKTQEDSYRVLVDVLGVPVDVQFEKVNRERPGILDYRAKVSRDQVELCYTRAVKLLFLRGGWEGDIHVTVFSSFAESRICFWSCPIYDDEMISCSLTISIFYHCASELVFEVKGEKERVLQDFLTEQNQLTMFRFSSEIEKCEVANDTAI